MKRLLLSLPMIVVVPLMACGTLFAGLLMLPLIALMFVASAIMVIAFGGTVANLAGFIWCHDPHLLANTTRFAGLFVVSASVPMFAGGCFSRLVLRRFVLPPRPVQAPSVRYGRR